MAVGSGWGQEVGQPMNQPTNRAADQGRRTQMWNCLTVGYGRSLLKQKAL